MALKATKREEIGTRRVKKAREAGYIPAVLYGQGASPTPLYIERAQLSKEHLALGHSLDLDVDGKTVRAIVKDEQRDALSDQVLHIDFQALSAGSTVTINVPITLVGVPVGIKKGGILEFLTRDLEIELPAEKLIEEITLDVSQMDIGDVIHVGDLNLPAEAKISKDPEEVVVSLAAPEEEEVVEEAAPTEAEPEVISRGKKEEEEEG
jgi:large subunit ribosomal protein L25